LRRLHEGLPKEVREKLDITMITKDEWHYFPPLFADLALGEVEVDQ
jgi:NADH dehydrogenase FAD-containing subunit